MKNKFFQIFWQKGMWTAVWRLMLLRIFYIHENGLSLAAFAHWQKHGCKERSRSMWYWKGLRNYSRYCYGIGMSCWIWNIWKFCVILHPFGFAWIAGSHVKRNGAAKTMMLVALCRSSRCSFHTDAGFPFQSAFDSPYSAWQMNAFDLKLETSRNVILQDI